MTPRDNSPADLAPCPFCGAECREIIDGYGIERYKAVEHPRGACILGGKCFRLDGWIRRLQSAPRTGEGLPEPEQSPSPGNLAELEKAKQWLRGTRNSVAWRYGMILMAEIDRLQAQPSRAPAPRTDLDEWAFRDGFYAGAEYMGWSDADAAGCDAQIGQANAEAWEKRKARIEAQPPPGAKEGGTDAAH